MHPERENPPEDDAHLQTLPPSRSKDILMIYLASASPRRHELLCQAAIAHTVLHVPSPPGEDEPRLRGESPDAYVQRTAHEKALRALYWLGMNVDGAQPEWPRSTQPAPVHPVLTADTTVILGDDVLGKPSDAEEAARMLRRLSGTLHEVHTAIVLALPGSDVHARAAADPARPAWRQPQSNQFMCDVSRTQVRFKVLDEEEIAAYCASCEPMGKAGAYGIQGRAARFIEHISGSYTGVVGLPLYETARLLRQGGVAI